MNVTRNSTGRGREWFLPLPTRQRCLCTQKQELPVFGATRYSSSFVFPLYLNSALQIWTVSQVADGVLFISTSTVYGAALATDQANRKLIHLLMYSP